MLIGCRSVLVIRCFPPPPDPHLQANPESGWPGESGWLGRLVQHVRQLRGGGTSVYAACALSEIPALSQQLLRSSLFETMDDALFTGQRSHHDDPSTVVTHAYETSACPAAFATPSEWADVKRQLALLLRNAMACPRKHEVAMAETFMATSR